MWVEAISRRGSVWGSNGGGGYLSVLRGRVVREEQLKITESSMEREKWEYEGRLESGQWGWRGGRKREKREKEKEK